MTEPSDAVQTPAGWETTMLGVFSTVEAPVEPINPDTIPF